MLLRHPLAAASLLDFAPGTYFKPIIYNLALDPKKVEKVKKFNLIRFLF